LHNPAAGELTPPCALHEDKANATQATVIETPRLVNFIEILLALKALQGAQDWLFRVASVIS
jgi:hypothetical protein